LPERAVIDEDFPTSFSEEYLLNPDGRLEIHRTYSGHTAIPKCTSISAFAVHPTAKGVSDLLQLKNPELKKRALELKADLKDVDQKINAQLRQRIRDAVKRLDCQPVLVPLNEANAKSAWDGIKTYLPVFALFKADRASTDQDPEAQDPLKSAVKEAIKQKEAELQAIASHVENEVKKIAQITLEKLKEMDPTLAGQLNPQFSTLRWESLFKASITGDGDIPINKRGSGVKRLILLNFFRGRAEQEARERGIASVIYAVEEPETSQHPHNQRMLVSALMDLATDNQVIITTHTPMLARTLPEQCLQYVYEKEDKTREVVQGGGTTNGLIAKSLGVLPDNSIKLFIGIEGPHDIAFLKHVSRVLRTAGANVLDLEKMELDGELIFFPLGGSSLALWTSRLAALSRPEFHLYDRDTEPPALARYHAAIEQLNQRPRCKALSTGKKEMENYVHFEAVNETYNRFSISLGLTSGFGDFEDVPSLVAARVHSLSDAQKEWSELSDATRKLKASRAKANLNNIAASLMTKERLEQVDPSGDIIGWFSHMRQLIDG
jgi:putative ATP-dependent endonuclease of OLD family